MSLKASAKFSSLTCILLAPLLLSSLTLAQADKNFQYLLFEPSLLGEQPALPDSELMPNPVAITEQAVAIDALAATTSLPGVPQNPLNGEALATLSATTEELVQQVATPVTSEEFLNSRSSVPAGDTTTIDHDIANYKKLILDLELKGGAYEAKLSEELLSLASLYQKTGDYAEAQKILNRAAHISRINNGLFDASQIPVIKKVIENYVELGDLLEADRQQQALFYMQRKIYGDTSPGLLPGLKYFAEWNLFAATTTITPPPVTDDSEADKKPIVDMVTFQLEHLIAARDLYEGMRQILIRNPGFNEDDLLDAEQQQLLAIYIFATRYRPQIRSYEFSGIYGFASSPIDSGDFIYGADLDYRNGIDILERRITRLQEQSPLDHEQLARAKIELADWLLTFEKRTTGLNLLEETYRDLHGASASENELNQLLDPALPRAIPTFVHRRYTRAYLGIPDEVKLQHKGYIDVEFKVSRFGAPSSITILGMSPDTDEKIADRLVSHIRYAQYRPRVQAGSVKAGDLYQLRYHYTY